MTRQLAFYCISLFIIHVVASCQEPAKTNHLAGSSSPYLLQHAHNPVDWFPWSDNALTKAKKENKLLLVSVGYSACHWCHVMEREVFSDTAVARFMNQHFVAIKVDREERPDLDAYYLRACLLTDGGSSGWPLNTFAVPDGRPVSSTTYLPRENWLEVLKYFVKVQKDSPQKLLTYAAELEAGIHQSFQLPPLDSSSPPLDFTTYNQTLTGFIDWTYGGLSGAPKFPLPVTFQYLYTVGEVLHDSLARRGVRLTLDQLALSGVYDQIGGGFARYATDDRWRIPHFEKMLYDNALLIKLYAQVFQSVHDPGYARLIRESIDFVYRDLGAKDHFYSSLDADSGGEEGAYYQWTWQDWVAAFPDPTVQGLTADYFGIVRTGNWELGKNIPYIAKSIAALQAKYGKDSLEIASAMMESLAHLKSLRNRRNKPAVDDKMITSWNALMIQALVASAQALGNRSYQRAAQDAADWIWENMLDLHQQLYRIYRNGHRYRPAYLDDYANLIRAYLDLYELTFDIKWVNRANQLSQDVLRRFGDKDQPLLFQSQREESTTPFDRSVQVQDEILPCANAVMASNLSRLGNMLEEANYRQRATDMAASVIPRAEDPVSYASWLSVKLELTHPGHDIVIIGENAAAIRTEMQKQMLPLDHFMGSDRDENLALLKGKYRPGQTWIYVCEQGVCLRPVQSSEEALTLLRAN